MKQGRKIGIALVLVSIIFIFVTSALLKDIEKERSKLEEMTAHTSENVVKRIEREYTTVHEQKYGRDIDKYDKANEIVHKFIRLINEKQFEEAYKMIHEEYAEDFALTFNKFSAIYDFEQEKAFVAEDFRTLGNHYVLQTQLYDFRPPDVPDFDVTSMSRNFTVFVQDNEYKIADMDIFNIEHLDVKETIENIEIKILKKYTLANSSVYKIEIKNHKTHTINIQPDRYGIYTTANQRVYPSELINNLPTDYSIAPNDTQEYLIKFNNIRHIYNMTFIIDNNTININL